MSQTVLITGASRGLGLGLVKQFLSHGYRVIATCRNPSQATDLCEALKNANQSPPLALDVASDESVESLRDFLVSNQLEVNHLINNAGISNKDHPVEDPDKVNRQEMLEIFNTNVAGVAKVTEASGVLRPENKGGKVVNISSAMGSISQTVQSGRFNAVSYRCSKAGQNMLTACLALQQPHLTCVMIHPGWVQTDMGGAGGRTADISTQQSVEGIFNVFSGLTPGQSGTFLDWKGDQLTF